MAGRGRKSQGMKAGIRRPRTPGETWSFVSRHGLREAQRCHACGRAGRFWVGVKLLECCPRCGGPLVLTRELRLIEHSGYATLEDAQLAQAEDRIQRGRGAQIMVTHLTVADWLRQWCEELGREGHKPLKPLTLEFYGREVAQHLIGPPRRPFSLGLVELRKLNSEMITAHYALLARPYPALDKKGRLVTRPGLSLSSRRLVHATLRAALNVAVQRHLIARNPAWRMTPYPVDGEEEHEPHLRCWSPEQLQRFLESVADDPLFALWHVFAAYGLRRGEALALRWGDVDLEAGRMTIRRNRVPLQGGCIVEGTTKTKRIRELPLSNSTVSVLRSHRSRQRGGDVVDFARLADEAKAYVFTDDAGLPLNPNSVTWRFRKAVLATGLPLIPLHGLRHTCGTSLLQKGVSPTVVAKILGHSNVTTTLNVYSHALSGAVAEAIDVMATILEQGTR